MKETVEIKEEDSKGRKKNLLRGKDEDYKTMVERDEEGKGKREHSKRIMKEDGKNY